MALHGLPDSESVEVGSFRAFRTNKLSLVPVERIEQSILVIRGDKVMLDRDLAELFGVPIKVFNQAIRRNSNRFPEDFMFRLTKREFDSLRSQIATLEHF